MRNKSLTYLLCFAFSGLFFITMNAQASWELHKEEDGIQVFTRKQEGKKIKELRIEMTFSTSLQELMAAFQDIENHKTWVFRTPVSERVKRLGKQSLIYYVMLDFPFPANDRDIVIHYSWSQDPITKIVETRSTTSNYELPLEEGIIRVKDFGTHYTLIPLPENKVKIIYEAWLNPEGSIPAWMVNLAVSKGPTKSMKALRDLLSTGKYSNASIEGIIELAQ